MTLADVIDAHILATLQSHGGNRAQAAEALGISRWSLARRINKSRGLQATVGRWHRCKVGTRRTLPCDVCGRA